ncbi:class I SAM-dependent methyltransferase [Streptomyces kanamyceticus]|uniref:Class I SAM-dependent methyltransferase n=1 Tax=Streptomyces kanamyceticus TaxID=1967 RepID=A0A5J6GLB4_STRKN|nr:class I SAM-dependent methyltransferase [Streptomyces kanamyceticus]QEU95997.1 class I SAM-dependent methyltransferase [Streptomyces kanamyceticus]
MSDLDSQTPYWDAAAPTKTFTHPLHAPWLADVPRDAAVLDYGCGYGRTMAALAQLGFGDLSGVDTSPAMLSRARDLHPSMRFAVLDAPPALDRPDASVDVVVLFAVLTCVPRDAAQHGLIAELRRVLRPGGLLCVSDLLLQDDARNRERYDRFAERYGAYGVFETSDGAVCRHHTEHRLRSLLDGFDVVDDRRITVSTMNGHEAAGTQFLARRPVG